MAHVIAGEAKFVVKIDTDAARREAEKLPTPVTADPEKKTPAPRSQRDVPGGKPRAPDAAFDPIDHGKRLAQATWGGGLYDQVKDTAAAAVAPIPGAAGTIKAFGIAEKIGASGAAAALSAAAATVTDPALRLALTALTEGVEKLSTEFLEKLDEVRAEFDAFDESLQEVKDISVGAAALGGLDPAEIPELGANLWKVAEFESLGKSVQRRRSRAFLGRAIGDAGGKMFGAMFGGRSAR